MTQVQSRLRGGSSTNRIDGALMWGGCGLGGREGCLLIARLAVQSPTPPRPCAEVSLSKTLNPKLLPMGRPVPCMVARCRRYVCVCVYMCEYV